MLVRKRATLTGKTQFELVFKEGKSRAAKEVVLRALPNSLNATRFGLTVSRRVGNAVVRNKVKRRLREIIRRLNVKTGWDIVIIARNSAATAGFATLERSVTNVFKRADLTVVDNEGNSPRTD
jgi:ribonuclease P protein component